MTTTRLVLGSIVGLFGLYVCFMNWRILLKDLPLPLLPFFGAGLLICAAWIASAQVFGRFVWVPLLIDGGAVPWIVLRTIKPRE